MLIPSRLMRPTIVVIFDRLKDQMLICTPIRKSDGLSPEDVWDEAEKRLAKTVQTLNTPLKAEEKLMSQGLCLNINRIWRNPNSLKWLIVPLNTSKQVIFFRLFYPSDFRSRLIFPPLVFIVP